MTITLTLPVALAVAGAFFALLQLVLHAPSPSLLWRDLTTWEKWKGHLAPAFGVLAIIAGVSSAVLQST